eukprot:5187224-Prymnesium_polylepis.1
MRPHAAPREPNAAEQRGRCAPLRWTGLLAELLIHEGRLDESRLVTAYLPQLIGTAVDGATVNPCGRLLAPA